MYYLALLNAAVRRCKNGTWTEEAEVFDKYHADKMRSIRENGVRTRLQMIWKIYVYLRDMFKRKFVDLDLQNKFNEAVRDRLNALEEREFNQPPTPRNPRANRGDNDGEFRCGRCKSTAVHPGIGARECTFKIYKPKISKKMGRTADELMAEGKTRPEAIETAIEKHKNDN